MDSEPRTGHYVIADSPDAYETERLGLLEARSDPLTRTHLAQVGIAEGWCCLEVGAGRGSVARWMAERVGPSGHVVAADLNPRFLWEHAGPNLEVREHNVIEQDFETESYDLVHCRALVMHLSQPEEVLRRFAAALKPGGWLVVEEGDFGSFAAVDPSHPGAGDFDRVTRSMWDFLSQHDLMDGYFGRKLAGLFERTGLEAVGNEGFVHADRGGSPLARFWQLSIDVPGSELLTKAGVVTRPQIDAVLGLLGDPAFEFVGTTLYAAWGRKPLAT
ncbi:MAG: methyltransferase domain-containing protein [Deltaproteobacteria bacterium]|nr:methyltransferase domain-containing protein [Deltaproteobacteria bacterium]